MNDTNYEVPHCEGFSTPHSLSSWAQIFASGSSFQISFAVRDDAAHPYSKTGSIIVLYVLIFKFFERTREDKSKIGEQLFENRLATKVTAKWIPRLFTLFNKQETMQCASNIFYLGLFQSDKIFRVY